MISLDDSCAARRLPPLIQIVLSQVARERAAARLTDAGFEEKISRLIREELEPRGLFLLVRNLAGGRTRFLVKRFDTGQVCQLVEYPPDGANVSTDLPDPA